MVAGKTTIISILPGLTKPSSGPVLKFFNYDCSDRSTNKQERCSGVVPQELGFYDPSFVPLLPITLCENQLGSFSSVNELNVAWIEEAFLYKLIFLPNKADAI